MRYWVVVVTIWASMSGLVGAAPAFAITSLSRNASGQTVLRWTAETNAFGNLLFTVQGSVSATSFAAISGPISEISSLVFTDSVLSASSSAFYRIAAAPAFTPLNQSGAFTAYAASNVNGLNTDGYAGAVFDGRYVYFVPYHDNAGSGRVLRYDTQLDFTDTASWAAHDASGTGNGGAFGYTGGVFDGRFIYFSPQMGHGRVLRYDTQGTFTNGASWALYDAGATDGLLTQGFQGITFDGRYVYFVPHFNTNWNGIVLRYDTKAGFTNASSWHAYDAGNTSGLNTKGYSAGVFDGRYVYFTPVFNGTGNGNVLRYDPQGSLTNSSSWLAYDASHTAGLNTTIYKGAVFDGRYVYFAPDINNGPGAALRYDTQSGFTNAASWSAYPLFTDGYDGAIFDGRYVYFVPYQTSTNSAFHGRVVSYDTQAAFTNSASWRVIDAGVTSGLQTQGYVGAVSDGRYLYFAPYRNNTNYHGNVLRFDARLPRGIPATVFGGSNL
jgi:hypothetical protein